MNPDDLITEIKSRFDHATQRKLLREKYSSKMSFAHAGGMWKAGPDLINLLNACSDNTAVIEDAYGNPVQIEVKELKNLSEQRWQEQMNAWLEEHNKLRRER